MNTSTSDRFDDRLEINGVGDIRSIREQTLGNGKVWACEIVLVRLGQVIDCQVEGYEAAFLIGMLETADREGRRIRAGFRTSHVSAQIAYVGKPAKIDAVMKGHLIFLAWIDVDGHRVYTDTRTNTNVTAYATREAFIMRTRDVKMALDHLPAIEREWLEDSKTGRFSRMATEPEESTWVCNACGHEGVDPWEWGCAECGAEADAY